MSTTTEGPFRVAQPSDEVRSTDRPVVSFGQTRAYLPRIILLLSCIGLLVGGAYAATWIFRSAGPEVARTTSTYPVVREELLITVTEDGNIESASNIDIKCEVAGGSSILWIVEDGKEVKKDDKLVEFDSSSLDEQINAQKITFNKARSALIQAQKDYEVAKISVKEYLEGTFMKELEDIETQIIIAEENLRSAQNLRDYSARMFQRGYISELELESQQFAVKRAELELNSANMAKEVLEKFTKEKTMEELTSQVETSKAAMESEQASFELEEGKLKRLETQLENCTILAPQGGMVVYANEMSNRGQQAVTIEEGATVRERQDILRLPDLSEMQVKVKVHETKVEDLSVNMRARVKVQGRTFQGVVVTIANRPEPTSWFQGDVKEYATTVRIDGRPKNLKPGMTAEVEILIAHLKDVITLPVSAVVEKRNEYLCWVKTPEGEVEKRNLLLGLSNDQFVEIKDGVAEGDTVIRNPRAVVDESREGGEEVEEVDVKERFGDAKAEPATPGKQNTPPTGPERGAGGPPQGRGGQQAGAGQRGSGGLMQYDSDGDGKVSKDEAPERMRPYFDRLDGNGDGFIDSAEIKAMESRFRSNGGGRRPPGGDSSGSPTGNPNS